VTNNVKDFQRPSQELGFQIRRPPDFLELLRKESSP
jgi:hypothetical protein